MKKIFILLIVITSLISITIFVIQNAQISLKTPTVAPPSVPPEEFRISIKATPISAFGVSLLVETNIPLPVEVMASLSMKGQKPKDIYIGVSKRITLNSMKQKIEIDGKNENLPSGEYIAEVTFYPAWGAENGAKEARQIKEAVTGQADVMLTGSGASKDQADDQNIKQKWIMFNIYMGVPWNEEMFVSKLGNFSKLESKLKSYDAYYFKKADMTIFVDRQKKAVSFWRMGQAIE
jgi:hypothetical protein